MRRETNLIHAIQFPLKNRILPEAPAIDGNIIGDRNTRLPAVPSAPT